MVLELFGHVGPTTNAQTRGCTEHDDCTVLDIWAQTTDNAHPNTLSLNASLTTLTLEHASKHVGLPGH
eukprot:8140274-Alexandrium_andersonii.AAC.1